MRCPVCESEQLFKNGVRQLKRGDAVQCYRCKGCHKRFNARTGMPMSGMKSSVQTVATVLRARGEGLGLRAAGRVAGNSHSTSALWEARLSQHQSYWSPSPSATSELTLEGDELYPSFRRLRLGKK